MVASHSQLEDMFGRRPRPLLIARVQLRVTLRKSTRGIKLTLKCVGGVTLVIAEEFAIFNFFAANHRGRQRISKRDAPAQESLSFVELRLPKASLCLTGAFQRLFVCRDTKLAGCRISASKLESFLIRTAVAVGFTFEGTAIEII